MLGFDGLSLPIEIRSLARDFDIGGIILFSRNVDSPEQVAELSRDAAGLWSDPPAWVAVDQEGGRVARLRRPFTEWPPMATLGASGDRSLARRFGEALARELRSVGVTLDFAPVLDVLTNPANPVIGDRALAGKPEDVARLGTAIIEALQAGGVAACGKHFPGHGDTSVDSHHALPRVDHGPDRLEAIELVPFKAAIEAGVAAIMTGHLLVSSVDEARPASMSRAVVTGLLREQIGFDRLVFTDDISMRACADAYTPEEATISAVNAGTDGVLLCQPDHASQAAALEALVHAVERGDVAFTTIEHAIARQRRAKERFLGTPHAPAPSAANWRGTIGCELHQLVAREMEKYSTCHS